MDRPSEFDYTPSLASLVRTAPPFVGRRQQLEWFEHCLQGVSAGQPQVVLIAGEAGIGKTRLLKEVWAMALRRGVQVCSGRCYEDLSFPYFPFVEALFAHLEHAPEEVRRSLGAEVDVIGQFLRPEQTTLSVATLAAAGQGDQEKLQLLVTVARATITLAQRCPTLLIVDDLHWADGPSLDLFGHLVFTVADTAVRERVPLLIIGTYRPEEPGERLTRLIARFQREDICQTLLLPGLHEEEVRELIQSLGLVRPSHQLVATIMAATQGNPLFVQEVIYHLRQQGTLQERGGYMATTSSPADLRLPERVTGAILAHIQELSEGCRTVLTLAAFLGDHISPQVLSAVSGVDEEALLDSLDEGMQQRLLLSEGQAFGFAHSLIRHVLYNEPSVVRRQRLHWHIAQTLEHLYADSLDLHLLEIAHHLIRAGPAAETDKVIQYARRAGDQAFAAFAWGEAAYYYEAALAAAAPTSGLALQDRAELHYRAGLARYRDMDVGPCLDHYEKAIATYRLTGDLRGLAQVLMEKTRLHYTLAPVPYGTLVNVQPLEEVLEALGASESRLRGSILAIMAVVYWYARQPDKAIAMAQRALEIGQRLADDRLCAQAQQGLALAYMQSLRVWEELESLQHALVDARRVNDLWLEGWPLQRLPMALTLLGRLDEAEAAAAEADASTRKTHNWGDYSLALGALVCAAVAKGDFAAAERRAQDTLLMVARSRYPLGGALALPALACARALRGAWAEAEQALDLLLEPGRVFEEPGPVFQTLAQMYHRLLRASAKALDAEAVAEMTRELAATPWNTEWRGYVDVTSLAPLCALIELGDFLAAPTLTEQPYRALSWATEQGVLFSRGWMFLLPRVLGVAATLNRWWDKAEAHFQAAITAATSAGAQPELGRAYLDYARMLAARGSMSDRQRAIELVRQAESIFNALGMAPFARRAAQLAEGLQARVPMAPGQRAAYLEHLSEREVGILLQVARGRTNFLG